MENKPIIHAIAATFLALGEAVGEEALQRAGNLLRDLIADEVMNAETADILKTILVGIDHDPAQPSFEELTRATAH